MSRSIHDTHRVAVREWKNATRVDTPDAWRRAEVARENIHRQRSIRKRVRQTRARERPLPMSPSAVPIVRLADGPGIHHGASERDLREVMWRLPPGSIDGLGSIQLGLEAAHAPRGELLGVTVPHQRGSYRERTRQIWLHAFEDVETIEPEVACFMRLSILGTFVHELAHHFDFMFRCTGDRWRMDDREKTEAFAHQRALEHMERIVVPYLDETYPDDWRTLDWWSSRLETLV